MIALSDIQRQRIEQMWPDFDTLEIATSLGVKESQVYNFLSRRTPPGYTKREKFIRDQNIRKMRVRL